MNSDSIEYSEADVRAILKRAAELQGSSEQVTDQATTSDTGLTRAELDEIGSSAGIDSRFIAAAVAQLTTASAAPTETNWWGGPTSASVLGTVPGAMTDMEWETVLTRLRHSLGLHGMVTSRPLVREWSSSERTSGEGYLLTAESKEDQTKLTLSWHNPVLPAPFYVISTVLTVILIPVIFESLGLVSAAGAFLFLLAATTLFAAARFGLSKSVASERKSIEKLMSSITSELSASRSGTAPSVASPSRPEEKTTPADLLDSVDDVFEVDNNRTADKQRQTE